MAPPNKKGFSIKFDLSLAGLLGVGVVCFCVFLWMFLLGVWAGQTGLISGMSFSTPAVPAPVSGAVKAGTPKRVAPPDPVAAPEPESPPVASPPAVPPPTPAAPVPLVPAVAVSAGEKQPPASPPKKTVESAAAKVKSPEAPFYSIQVGAFRDNKNVEDELRLWRDRGYEPFARPPKESEHLTKVFVGHYGDAAEAKKQEAILTKKRKISPLIVMIRPD